MMIFRKDDFKKEFYESLIQQEKGEIALSYIFHLKQFMWGSKEQMISQMKTWRKESKQGILKICKYNNRSYEYEGNTFYTFIVQPYKDGKLDLCPMEVVSTLIFGTTVCGYMYVFKTQENRDNIYNYVMKDIEEPKSRKELSENEEGRK